MTQRSPRGRNAPALQVITAFISQADHEIRKLSADIRKTTGGGASGAVVQALYGRFRELKASATKHEQFLGDSIEDARTSMEIVEKQPKKPPRP